MILYKTVDNILNSPHRHIVFGINAEGDNDAGFAGVVSAKYWPELSDIGPCELGTILTHEVDGRFFHAFVVHDFGETRWTKAPEIIEKCLNELDVPENKIIATTLIGGGFFGAVSGSNVEENLAAMERSKKTVIVYSL